MDSSRNKCHINDEDIEENVQDNRKLSVQKDEMDENGPKSLIMEIYPWIPQFKKMCRTSLAQRSMSSLKNLMTFYARNVRPSVNECRTKPLRAEKLKDSISETLLFFLYYFRDVGELKDRDYYSIVMSDLLAMYIDMELKASKKGKEHCSKISARLSSCLHVYLENSAEHLLDTLLKVHFMTHNYREILDPVITKIFRIIEDHPSSSIMYVRYLLVYRLWKKLNKDVAVRNQINVIAQTSLGIAPIDLPTFINESVLPQVPEGQKISTKLLLLQKFEMEKSCEEFLNFCNKKRGPKSGKNEDESCMPSTIASLPEDNNDCRETIKNNNNLSIITNKVASLIVNSSVNDRNLEKASKRPSVSKAAVSSNLSSFRRTKKSNDIVFIDLTSEAVTEKIIRNKKTRRKLFWLEEAKKRISSKINAKKDSTIEDTTEPEDNPDLRSLRISVSRSPSSKMEHRVERVSEKNEEDTRDIDEVSSRLASIVTNQDILSTDTNGLVDESSRIVQWNQIEDQTNEKNRVENEKIMDKREVKVFTSNHEVSSSQPETDSLDQYAKDTRFDDSRELPLGDIVNVIERSVKSNETEQDGKNKKLAEENVPLRLAIKPESTNIRSDEIMNEPSDTSQMKIQVAEYASEITLIRDEQSEPRKIHEVEFQENIDGLSLLASVSQRISHLTTATENVNRVKLIKVKNYASLADPSIVEEAVTSSNSLPLINEPSSIGSIDRIIDIYPEDEMNKVAYQVEITSTDETGENYEGANELVNFMNSEETRCGLAQTQSSLVTVGESTNLMEKDDTNVILNGETVVLFQKSPNSNLYIINKAVENRDHDDIANAHRDISEHVNNETAAKFPYELYDSIYRNQTTGYDIAQYNRELPSQESRRGKATKPEQQQQQQQQPGEMNNVCDSTELGKSIMSHDAIGDKTRIKRNTTGSSISRRRRIKQEYNSEISTRMKSSYAIQDCPQEHKDSTRSIHIPVAHAPPMYTKYSSGTELYLQCHKSCNSLTCGLPVNQNGPHLHSATNSAPTSRCSCLDCTYGIVAHCSECIMPNGETRGASLDANSYYMPLHPGQNSVVKDCNGTRIDETLAKIYDDRLVRNFEEKIMERKPLEGVKYEARDIYRAELDNKLPLKKRFKAIMSMSFVDDAPIKCEKIQSYPGTPMISIAALEATEQNDDETKNSHVRSSIENSPDTTSKLVAKVDPRASQQTREMIRRDYHKDMIVSSPTAGAGTLHNGNRVNGAKRKREVSRNYSLTRDREDNYEKIAETGSFVLQQRDNVLRGDGVYKRGTDSSAKSQARPSERIMNGAEAIAMKNSTRQTRSSKRNVPKVTYTYADGDSDWNPSGGVAVNAITKRKRRKTSR